MTIALIALLVALIVIGIGWALCAAAGHADRREAGDDPDYWNNGQ